MSHTPPYSNPCTDSSRVVSCSGFPCVFGEFPVAQDTSLSRNPEDPGHDQGDDS